MDWANRWFCCKNCALCIRSPKAFLDHKKKPCRTMGSTATSKTKLEKKRNDVNNGRTKTKAKLKKFKCEFCQYVCHKNSHLRNHIRTHTGETPYACTLCNYNFKRPDTLKNHSRGHTGETPFKCNECNASFNSQRYLGMHMSLQHKESKKKWLCCRFCSKVFTKTSRREDHERLHTGELPFKCVVCSATFNGKSHLYQHTRLTHKETKQFQCESCDYACHLRQQLIVHNRTHTGEKPFQCKLCSYTCKYSGELKLHGRGHLGETPFKCDECNASFNRQSYLGVHMSRQHPDLRYKFLCCRFCPKVFNKASRKEEHERLHTGERPFKCNTCDATFKRNSNLDCHKNRIHKKTKRFQCDSCDYNCYEQRQLVVHKRTHTGEKPDKCNVCDAKFKTSETRKVHMNVHKTTKDHKCTLCKYATANYHQLKRHNRIHTGKRPSATFLNIYSSTSRVNVTNECLSVHASDDKTQP